MRNSVPYLLFFVFLFLSSIRLSAETLLLDAQFEYLPLGTYIEVHEDFSRELTIEDILSNKQLNFKSQQHKELIYGARRDANIWLRISLQNTTQEEKSLRLRTGDTYLRYMWAYITDGQIILTEYLGGIQMPFSQRTILHRNSVFPITLPAGSNRTIILKIDGRWDSMQFPIELMTTRTFHYTAQRENMFYGVFFGFLLMIVLLTLILFLATRISLLIWYFS